MGVKRWVRADAVLPYRINFENLGPGRVDASGNPHSTFAPAPAQRVTISDPLSAHLYWNTFQLIELGFGDTMVPIPQSRAYYGGSVPMTFDGRTSNVGLETGVDQASGRVFAVFQSVDPIASLPPDVLTGFLPPEDGTCRGQGHGSFLIKARTNLITRTEIRNVALIEFDRQMTIATDQNNPHNPGSGVDPTKQALVTIDAGSPSSSVTALPAESGRAFAVQWSGADDASGSGIDSYDVYVSTNGTLFVPWFGNVTDPAAVVIGDLGQTYAFYSIARDKVGNLELPPVAPDAQTVISTNSPMRAAVTNLTLNVGEPFTLSNSLVYLVEGHTYTVALDSRSIALGAKINPTNGTLSWAPKCHQARSASALTLWVTNNTWTNLSDVMTTIAVVKECLESTPGTLILPIGQTGRLPSNLLTSEPVTNLTMGLALQLGRLEAVNAEVRPEVTDTICSAWMQPAARPLPVIGLAACSNAWMMGTQQGARLYPTAPPNQPSSFQWVHIGQFVGTRPDGTLVINLNTQSGRVVVLDEEPLLEAVRGTNGQPELMLYGIEASNYVLRATTDLSDSSSWQTYWQDAITNNLVRQFNSIGAANRALFFRAGRGP